MGFKEVVAGARIMESLAGENVEQQVDWLKHDSALQQQVESVGRNKFVTLDKPLVYGIQVLPSIGGAGVFAVLAGNNGETYAVLENANCIKDTLNGDDELGPQKGKKLLGFFNSGTYTPDVRVDKLTILKETDTVAGTPTLARVVGMVYEGKKVECKYVSHTGDFVRGSARNTVEGWKTLYEILRAYGPEIFKSVTKQVDK